MTESQAVELVMASRNIFEVPQYFNIRYAEKRIIELVDNGQPVRDELPGPGQVYDIVAWVIGLGFEVLEAEFAVDDLSGKIVRFRKSRAAIGHFKTKVRDLNE